ncbi:hypothetical protein ACWEPN_07195 [Nonomuraea wenchangensis]
MWLVVAGGVDGQLAEEFAGDGVDDADVEVFDEEHGAGPGVGSADADVVQASGQAEDDDSGLVDAVVAYAGAVARPPRRSACAAPSA